MRTTTVSVAGLDRSSWQLFTGFSLAVAFLLVGFGALNLLVVRHAPELLDRTRALLRVDAAAVLALLTISLVLFPPPPVLLLGVAAAATGTALRRPAGRPGGRHRSSTAPSASTPPSAGTTGPGISVTSEVGAGRRERLRSRPGRSTGRERVGPQAPGEGRSRCAS